MKSKELLNSESVFKSLMPEFKDLNLKKNEKGEVEINKEVSILKVLMENIKNDRQAEKFLTLLDLDLEHAIKDLKDTDDFIIDLFSKVDMNEDNKDEVEILLNIKKDILDYLDKKDKNSEIALEGTFNQIIEFLNDENNKDPYVKEIMTHLHNNLLIVFLTRKIMTVVSKIQVVKLSKGA